MEWSNPNSLYIIVPNLAVDGFVAEVYLLFTFS